MSNKKTPAPTGACEALAAPILTAPDNRHSALEQLPMLEGLGPLLPGAADKRPTVGDGWPEHPGLSIAQLEAAEPECICWHIGADVNHIAVDVDGALAAAFCQSHGCDPYTADTWRIIRTSNTERLKLVFSVTTEQKAALVAGAKTVKIEGQELAVFSASGHQIVVLGNHYTKESNFTENDDQYDWAGRAPSDAQPMPPEWFALLTGVFCGERPLKPPTVRQVSAPSSRKANAYSNRGGWSNSCQRQPCPMCGRDHSGACSINRDRDSVWCCHGETKSAPDCSKAGETKPGTDGRIWAYVRTEEHDSFGERSLFVLHKPPQDGRESSAGTSEGKSTTLKAGRIVKELPHRVGELPATGVAVASRREVDECTYSELLRAMLLATINDDDDELMQMRAETISRFRRTDAQIEAALFKLHTQQQVQGKAVVQPESLDLSRISGMDWLIEGFVPDNDLTLLWGNAGGGKTTAALAAACSVLSGTGLLDHTQPAPQRNVLFIASDSGAPPLYAAMQEMGMADMAEVQDGPQKRFHVWASDPEQGMTAWAADLRGCIHLLDFITRHQIGLVLIDSCKAVCSGAGLDYTNNQLVTALLTYFKEVICPHAAVVWLNHDGVAKGAHAGAKAWKEIPSMVHAIIREENKDGSFVNSRRHWRVTKSRMGICREFYYELNQGQLQLSPNQEKVGNCLARVVDVLMGAWQLQGQESLAKADLVERICNHGGPSRKTLENSLSTATRAKHPEICRAGRGRYKLAPRIADSLKGCILNGKEEGQIAVVESDHLTTRQVPMGSSLEPGNFPAGSNGKSPECSDANRSTHVPSQSECTPYGEGIIPGLDLAGMKTTLPGSVGSSWDTGAE